MTPTVWKIRRHRLSLETPKFRITLNNTAPERTNGAARISKIGDPASISCFKTFLIRSSLHPQQRLQADMRASGPHTCSH
jgi:hypothetical protein